MQLINTRSDLDAIAGTPEHEAFMNMLKGSVYRLEKNDQAKQWTLHVDTSTIENYGFSLLDFPGLEEPAIPQYLDKPLEERFEEVRKALQAAIDVKAISFGFKSGGNALMLYAGFVNPYQPLAQVFATWEASVWADADAYKNEVIAGNKPMLSGDQAVALMPVYPT